MLSNDRIFPICTDLAKIIVLGLINGMSEYSTQSRINEKIGLNLQAGDVKVIERFFELHPNIDIWRDESVKGARSKGSISTGLGRYLDVTQETKTTTLYNFPVQGTGADGFKMALLDLDERLEGMDAKVVHTMQDEISEKVADILEECMIKPFEALVPSVPDEVELRIQDRWKTRSR